MNPSPRDISEGEAQAQESLRVPEMRRCAWCGSRSATCPFARQAIDCIERRPPRLSPDFGPQRAQPLTVRSYTGYARRVTPVPGAGGPLTFRALTSEGLEIPEWEWQGVADELREAEDEQRRREVEFVRGVEAWQEVWRAPLVEIFDAYERWKRPWWARALAWLIAGYYAVKR